MPVERWRAVTRLRNQVNDVLEGVLQVDHQLAVNEFEVLGAVVETVGGYLRMQVLAETAGLPQSTTSRLVARLEAAGLLERYLCDDDRRGVFTRVTAHGRSVHAAAARTHRRALEAALDAAATDPDLASIVAVVRG